VFLSLENGYEVRYSDESQRKEGSENAEMKGRSSGRCRRLLKNDSNSLGLVLNYREKVQALESRH
jgi:hypothetical protein